MDGIKDYVDIRFSAESSNIAEEIKEKFFFSQTISIFRFAAAFAFKEYKDNMDFEKLDYEYDKNGINYHSASFDFDGSFSKLITAIYPWCSTPYKYARVAAIFGLLKLKEKLSADPDYNIVDLVIQDNS